MPIATLELPAIRNQHTFNLKRWREVCADPVLARLEFRIETDRYGHILMTPPPGFDHSSHQSDVAFELRRLMPHGRTLVEVPISTTDGIKGADAAWISRKRCAKAVKENVLIIVPEICVEVLSRGNTRAEMLAKKALYFEGGAEEVWFCDRKGRMFFYLAEEPDEPAKTSRLCPEFPRQLG
jgi:Uma2 family endonuclease